MDKGRLIKLLNLTQSDNDNEALSALRKANALLKKAGKAWEDFLVVGSIKTNYSQSQQSRPRHTRNRADNETMIVELKKVYHDLTTWEQNFLDSVDHWFSKKGFLTEKQELTLGRIYMKKAA